MGYYEFIGQTREKEAEYNFQFDGWEYTTMHIK